MNDDNEDNDDELLLLVDPLDNNNRPADIYLSERRHRNIL